MAQSIAFERDDSLYLVTPLAPIEMEESAIDELAFAKSLKSTAPNERLVWMRGQYVEADRANANGGMWVADDLAIKSLTPRLMPVTVMHDFRTAVGLIADTQLVEKSATVPRTRIDTTLALWGHRFPDVVEEALRNYAEGSLMQSMECHVPHYECAECGQRFVRMPDGSERKNWCAHLNGETAAGAGRAARRLLDVTFTGTGLIFGSRGSRGALDTAHLELFQDEVAEFHHRAGSPKTKRARSKRVMDIDDKRYEELVAAEAKAKELAPRVAELEPEAAKVADLTAANEKLEVDKKAAEDALAAEKVKREQLEETARAAELSTERVSKLGAGFLAKLPDGIKARLVDEQSKLLKDEEWTARLDELAELVGVKSDDGTVAKGGGSTFSAEEIARAGVSGSGNGNGGDGGEPTVAARQSVIGGLLTSLSGQKTGQK